MKQFLAALICTLAVGGAASFALQDNVEANEAKAAAPSNEIKRIEWSDLTPPLSAGAQQAAAELNMRIDQMTDDEIADAMDKIDAEGNSLMTELDDSNIEIEGFLVPIDFNVETATDFVLVPYFGACIHVPAPPPNQTVFVKFREGLAMAEFEQNYYYPFKVRGKMKVARAKTELAEVGYQVTASDIELGELE
jgi:hypothetical protein